MPLQTKRKLRKVCELQMMKPLSIFQSSSSSICALFSFKNFCNFVDHGKHHLLAISFSLSLLLSQLSKKFVIMFLTYIQENKILSVAGALSVRLPFFLGFLTAGCLVAGSFSLVFLAHLCLKNSNSENAISLFLAILNTVDFGHCCFEEFFCGDSLHLNVIDLLRNGRLSTRI